MRSLMCVVALVGMTGAAMGCSCSEPPVTTVPMGDSSMPHCDCLPANPPAAPDGQTCCMSTNMCVDYNVNDLCMPGFTCPVANVTLDGSCHVSCSMCVERPALNPGYLATDLDYVITSTGDQYLSGYSPGNPPSTQYGDLVVATVPSGDVGMIAWEVVDGAPATPVTGAPSGWRHGVAAPGDDVGRWSSMVAGASELYVSYYDATHGALKLAIGHPGAWTLQTVDDTGDAGRYSSIVLDSAGHPVIAYLGFEVNAMGEVHSQVRVAAASSAMPAAAADWTITRIGDAASPCRPSMCPTGQRCLATGTCVMPGTCTPACSGDTACVAGACAATLPMDYTEDLVPAHGLYTALAVTSTGFALVYYDRTQGNLYGVQATGSTWGAPFLIDGYGRSADAGDTGIGASIFIDRNDLWHITYVDGADEVLRYAQVTPGATPTVTVRELVDDGATSDGTTPNTDGRHIVGDDSSVVALVSGEIRVAYQDATVGRTMIARRTAPGVWTHGVLDSMKHNGFWVEQAASGEDTYVASWWLDRMAMTLTNGVHITRVPAP